MASLTGLRGMLDPAPDDLFPRDSNFREIIEISSDDEEDLDGYTSKRQFPLGLMQTLDTTFQPRGLLGDRYPRLTEFETGEPSKKRKRWSDLAATKPHSFTTDFFLDDADYFIGDTLHHTAIDTDPPQISGYASLPTDFNLNFINQGHVDRQVQPERVLKKREKPVLKVPPNFNRSKSFGKRPRQAPYYDDAKLGVRMYRGPGFEKFPIPLESAQHRMICDLWDKRQLQRAKRRRLSSPVITTNQLPLDNVTAQCGETPVEIEACSDLGTAELECLSQVLEVLPDIDHHFVLDVVELMTEGVVDDIEQMPSSNDVLAKIMEFNDYPKERNDEPGSKDTGRTIQVSRTSTSHPSYLRDATILLAEEFDFIPTHHIQRILREKSSLHEAYLALAQSEAVYQSPLDTSRSYKRLREPRQILEKKYSRKPNAIRDHGQWLTLISEIQAAKQQAMRKEIKDAEKIEKEATESANLQAHIASGHVIECQCCFDDEIPSNRSVSCQAEQPHKYCFQCIERLAGINTGSGKYEMLCMSQCGCKARLDPDGVSSAVPTSILRRLAFNQQHAEIDAAGISGLEKCPHCDFKGICDPVEIDPIFSCLDPECGKVSCRLCFEPAHTPKTCEQVKKEKGMLEKRHAIEEARSAAMMRTCPRCKKKAIKESGCNKVACTCGCVSCFVCQQDISKEMYRHFGPAPKCPQSDSFDRHQFDADQAEKAAIEKIRQQEPDIEETDLAIEEVTARDKRLQNVEQIQTRMTPAAFDLLRPMIGVGALMLPNDPALDYVNPFEAALPPDLGRHPNSAKQDYLMRIQMLAQARYQALRQYGQPGYQDNTERRTTITRDAIPQQERPPIPPFLAPQPNLANVRDPANQPGSPPTNQARWPASHHQAEVPLTYQETPSLWVPERRPFGMPSGTRGPDWR